MGKKHEKGSNKDLANKTKSKGLQKLRFYCEMCKKQCRDANGYKCHLSSESHQRQLLLVAEDPEKYVRQFSREFEENFLSILKNEFGTRRVLANDVYQEIVRERGHVHMNSTRWHSLSGFVQHLAEAGKCKIDKVDEKGWFIQLIDHEAAHRKEEAVKKQKAEKDDEEREQELINQQIERAKEIAGEQEEYKATDLVRSNDDEKIELSINFNKKPNLEDLNKPTTSISVFDKLTKVKKEEPDERRRDRDRRDDDRKQSRRSRSRSRSHDRDRKKDRSHRKDDRLKKSALDEIKEMNERKKEQMNRKDYWMHPGIVVKIVTKKLGANYYKTKGTVKSMIDHYTASVKLEDGTLLKLDQSHVETVIPQAGREMLIVNGAYRGQKAILDSLDERNFSLNLKISSGPLNGRSLQVAYEDASKLAV